MTIAFELADWIERLDGAVEYRRQFVGGLAETLEAYTGQGYRKSSVEQEQDPENHAFEWVSVFMPQLVYGNPQVRVKTSREGAVRDEAKALEFALNRWIRQASIRELNEQLATDYAFKYAVGLVTPEAMWGSEEMEDPPFWPAPSRVEIDEFVWDYTERDYKKWRWMGHLTSMQRDEIIAEAEEDPTSGWNLDVVRGLEADLWIEREITRDDDMEPPARDEDKGRLDFYAIWCPHVSAQDLADAGYDIDPADYPGADFHGSIFYVAVAQMGDWDDLLDDDYEDSRGRSSHVKFIRDPHPFYGPRTGPYTYFPGYFVPGEAITLAPLAATQAQADYVNAIARAIETGVEEYKRVVAVDGTDADLQDAIEAAENGSVVPLGNLDDDIRKKLMMIELGGLTDQLLVADQRARETLQRVSGMGPSSMGEVTGEATARENVLAFQSSQTRLGFLGIKFREGFLRMLNTAGWYLLKDDRVAFRLGADQGGGIYLGGLDKGAALERARDLFPELEDVPDELIDELTRQYEEARGNLQDDPYDSFDITIVAFSMERSAEQLKMQRAQQTLQYASVIAPLLIQAPHLRGEKLTELLAELSDLPELPDLFDYDLARKLAEAVLGATLAAGGTTSPQPRLGRDLGPRAGPQGLGLGMGGSPSVGPSGPPGVPGGASGGGGTLNGREQTLALPAGSRAG